MCGIYGIVDLTGEAAPSTASLGRMAAVLRHRGPDDEGSYGARGVALGMRRLSIIDVAGGHQPLANEDRTLWVVCNGEIYNYRALSEELTRAKHQFATRSDTEVIVHLYEEYSDALVRRLNGMFAFALWDSRRRRAVIARDRLGIKPLYYCHTSSRLLFASEAKALLAVLATCGDVDLEGLQEYLALGYTSAPRSIFKGIRKLPPASVMVCEKGQIKITRYWTPPSDRDDQMDEREWTDAVLATMETAVASQMVSDVPLGAFLSGGLDSSTIVSLMAQHSAKPIRTYSIGFANGAGAGYYNELPWAGRIAETLGTDHREILVKPDITRLLPRLLWHLDEPVADSAFITTYLVAEFARNDVTVILSGVGGDELFGGYRRYLAPYYDRYYDCVPRWLRTTVLLPMVRALPSDRHSPAMNLARHVRSYLQSHGRPLEERYRSYVEVFNQQHIDSVLREMAAKPVDGLHAAFREVRAGDPLSRLFTVDLLTQLPDDLLLLTDKMTMAASLECRVPFLDNTMIDLSLRMPSRFKIRGRQLKHILKQAFRPFLPPEILNRRKRGFGAPIGAWFKGELAPLVRSVLSRESLDKRGLLYPQAVAETIALHEASREDYTDHLLALINLELWCRLYLDGRSPEDVTSELTMATTGRGS